LASPDKESCAEDRQGKAESGRDRPTGAKLTKLKSESRGSRNAAIMAKRRPKLCTRCLSVLGFAPMADTLK
jgi:hypothetical protein